jgi:hypothetical protein
VKGNFALRCDQDIPYTQPNKESTATQHAIKVMAMTKDAFPTIRKTPNEAVLHSCHLENLSAGNEQLFTQKTHHTF